MKYIILSMLSILTFMSCTKEFEPEHIAPNIDSDTATVTLNFRAMDVVQTRSLADQEEQTIDDVNIFCVSGDDVIHRYVSNLSDGNTYSLSLPKMGWTIYAIANNGAMEKMSATEIAGYWYCTNGESDIIKNRRLVMFSKSAVNLAASTSLPINFTKAAAKLEVNINVDPSVADEITLTSVRLRKVPNWLKVFDPNGGSLAYGDYASRSCYDGVKLEMYMLENLAGVRSNITNETDKSMANAPTDATYIEIMAETITKNVTYRVFLGANNTSDFNVRRNHIYNIDIDIDGVNSSDKRVTINWKPVRDLIFSVRSASVDVTKYFSRSQNVLVSATTKLYAEFEIDQPLRYDLPLHFDMLETFGDKGNVHWGWNIPLIAHFKAEETVAKISAIHTVVNDAYFARLIPNVVNWSNDTTNELAIWMRDNNIGFWYTSFQDYSCTYTERTIIVN